MSYRKYHTDYLTKQAVKGEIKELLKAEIIEESESARASPLVAVAKPNGKIRLCID